ncbi:DNCL2 [Mytilus edulis]|uniref:DYNLRB n=1 Tax=Mytilus edulis TaxID=6550 RepID=A0A8S3T4A8_MYTED|nr:DNCL2 [Mytilus edulis]
MGSTPPRLNNCNSYPIPVSISATPTTTCNNTNILEEEIKHLKSQLGLKDKQLKTKESLICKQDSEIKLMKKELATNRALTIKLEQDKKDLEHSLLIQQQKPNNTVHEPSASNREDNSRSYAMEQRVRSLEFELLKQDNKISNLADKFIDFKIDNGRKQPRTRKKKQKVFNYQTADQFKPYSCAEKTPATYELLSTKETNVPPSSDKTEKSESCPSIKCPSTIPSDPEISESESTISPIESVKNLTTHMLNILSFNIEGLTSNLVYLYKLIKRSDIILLQEHWLYSHEKDNLYSNFIDFNCHIKCFDDGIIDDVVDRKRAHAGVAICVNNKYSPYLEKLPDGSNRIAAIRLNFEVPLVIISVYLPSRSINYSRDDYLSVLDELIEIVTKYRDSANILIGGDMNASIFRNHPRDNDFKNFLRNNNLRIPDNCVECSTFYHFNNRDESQIDYFIQNFDIINTYCTYSRESANTSTHDPIMVSVITKIQINQMLFQKANICSVLTGIRLINVNISDYGIKFTEEILDTWASYYEKLATPVDNPDFDDTYKLIVEQDISALTDTYTNNRDTLAPVSEKEVVQIINSLKNGKAPDASRVTCEHLKFGGKTLSYVLTSIITFSFSNHIIPTVFKNGLACPVFKKKGKPKEDPGSYRKITITNPVGKLTEKLHPVRNKDNISNIQSPLQKGFTQGEIPLVAALILTELHTEAKENGNPLIIALTDAKRVPTVADDVTLVSNCPYEIQSMLDLQTFHANKYRYLISSQKSCVLNYRCADSFDWSINGEILDTPEKPVHLGIKRDKLSRLGTKEVVPGRIQLARQTVYSLMGAGLYGLNGVNPKVSLHLIRCYVIPRLLYGLEVILLSKTDISNLTIYFVKLLKRIQHLPDRTANAAVLLLIGQIPIEAEIHKRILGIFRNIIDNDNSVERDLAFQLYDLPSPHDLLVNPPSKSKWKKLVNSSVNYYWITKLKSEASEKSSLNLLNYTDAEFGSIHSIWNTCGSEPYSTLRACIKSKLACNTYTLQCDKSKFSKRQISAICPICGIEDENRLHFILRCSSLDNSHEVEETLKRIQTHPGVVGTIVVNNEGIPIRTTLDNPTTVQYAGLIQSLTAKARSAIQGKILTHKMT